MKQFLLSILLCVFSTNTFAATWCGADDFKVAIVGGYVAVHEAPGLSTTGGYIFLGYHNTTQGEAIYSLLLAAQLSGSSFVYGDGTKSWACGEYPIYSTETLNPEFLYLEG